MKFVSGIFWALSSISLLLATGCSFFNQEDYQSSSVSTSTLGPFPGDHRRGHSLVASESSVIVWGGNTGSQDNALNDGFMYDLQKSEWSQIPESDIRPRSGHVAVISEKEMIVWGGFLDGFDDVTGDRLARDGHAFNIEDQRWRKIADAPEGRSNSVARYSQGKLVVGGGSGPNGKNKDLLIYSILDDAWQAVPVDFFVYEMEELASGDFYLLGMSDHGEMRGAVFSLEDLSVQGIEFVDAEDQKVRALGSTVSSDGDLLIISQDGHNSLLTYNGNFLEYEVERFGVRNIYGFAEYRRAPLDVGGLYELDQNILISASGAGVSVFEVQENEVNHFNVSVEKGNCGNGVELVKTGFGIFAVGGLGCSEDEDYGFLLESA
ncbi:hypothetical protein H4W79_004685 [Nocardiopsis terrae]|uniref:Galactose oxidase, central domain n=1 Tax=Nocardiopsis terrae TaxID=372655 RepID=A0ABR9HNA4_9ACTN|nr:kelch repeat-containing protein [Nocardiopsis terrae]MBE1460471.1 hypothetical protein [Nocardiopsis terrae]